MDAKRVPRFDSMLMLVLMLRADTTVRALSLAAQRYLCLDRSRLLVLQLVLYLYCCCLRLARRLKLV